MMHSLAGPKSGANAMIRRSSLSAVRAAAAAAILLVIGAGAASPAQAIDVTLENVTFPVAAGTVLLRQIIVEGGNLPREDIVKLFSTESSADIEPLAARLEATRIRIPETTLTETRGQLVIRDFEATGIRNGTAARISVAGVDGSVEMPKSGSGKIQVAMRPFQADNASFANFIHGIRAGVFSKLLTHASHVRWEGFDLNFPDSTVKTGDNVARVHLGSLEVTSSFSGDIPKNTDFEVKDLVVLPAKGSTTAQAIAGLGREKIELGFRLKGTYDMEAKVFTIDDYSLSAPAVGTLTAQGRIDNLDGAFYGDDAEKRKGAFQDARLGQVMLRYQDVGMFDRIVATAAERARKTPEALKAEWIAKTSQATTNLLGSNPSSGKLATELTKFIATPGTLTITASSTATLRLGDFNRFLLPMLLSQLTIDAAASK
jgi:hypothetical protein